jgi:hypothetical protein
MTIDAIEERESSTSAGDPAGQRRSVVLYSPDRDFCLSLSMMWKDEFDLVTTTDDDMIFALVQSIQPDVLLAEARPTVRLQRKFEFLKARFPKLRIVMICTAEIKNDDFSEHLGHFVDAMYSEPIDIVKFGKCVHSMEWTL